MENKALASELITDQEEVICSILSGLAESENDISRVTFLLGEILDLVDNEDEEYFIPNQYNQHKIYMHAVMALEYAHKIREGLILLMSQAFMYDQDKDEPEGD